MQKDGNRNIPFRCSLSIHHLLTGEDLKASLPWPDRGRRWLVAVRMPVIPQQLSKVQESRSGKQVQKIQFLTSQLKKMEYITVDCNYCICEDSKSKEKNQGAFQQIESFIVDGVKGLLFIDRLKHCTSIKFTVPIDDPHPATDTMSVNGATVIYGIWETLRLAIGVASDFLSIFSYQTAPQHENIHKSLSLNME